MDNDTITVGALGVRFLVEAADSNGSARCSSATSRPTRGCPRPHSHDGFEETIYGLEGATTWTIDGETIEIGPGEAVCVPRGRSTGLRTAAASTRSSSRSPPPASSGPTTSTRSASVLAASAGGPPDLAALRR